MPDPASTHIQYIVLVAIRRVGETETHVTQAAVCRFGSIDPNMASEVVRSLERKGFHYPQPPAHPERWPSRGPEHLTEKGAELSAQARLNQIKPMVREFFSPLGEDQRALALMLRRLSTKPHRNVRRTEIFLKWLLSIAQ